MLPLKNTNAGVSGAVACFDAARATSHYGAGVKWLLLANVGLTKSRVTIYWVDAAVSVAVFFPYRLLKRSTRPAVSTSFCLPVKNGWHEEQISTCKSDLRVERVLNVSPQAQVTVISLYSG